MTLSNIQDRLWGQKARLSYLLIAAAILLFTCLGVRDIWTQEHRWADIVSGMFYRHDFLHPYLGANDYYDKPLLSYWLIALAAKLMGALTTWSLRLPSVLAGLLAIGSVYQLGKILKDKSLGYLSGWLLLTTFYFVFWARTSSADMLNLAGSVFAVAWYMTKRDKPSFYHYAIFFLIIALTSLCKGLIGAIVPVIAVLTDMVLRQSWRQHLRLQVVLAALPALMIYVFPFWASSYFGGDSYGQNGLYLVYRENILRYFQPFDHQGPIYTYFLYLPIYLLPWAIFFIPALLSLKRRWLGLSVNSKWIVWTLLALFVFFTLSGSRRSYYVLPMVPFAILLTADWMSSASVKWRHWSAGLVVSVFMVLWLAVDLVPAWYYSAVGMSRFATTLKSEAEKVQPWGAWNVVMLDAESKLNFYLGLPPTQVNYRIKGSLRDLQTPSSLRQVWPVLENMPKNTIFITRKLYAPMLQSYFANYRMVALPPKMINKKDVSAPIAFIPIS